MKQENVYGLPKGRTLAFERIEKVKKNKQVVEYRNIAVYFVDEDNKVEIRPVKKDEYAIDLDALRNRYQNYRVQRETQLRANPPENLAGELKIALNVLKQSEERAIEQLDAVYACIKE